MCLCPCYIVSTEYYIFLSKYQFFDDQNIELYSLQKGKGCGGTQDFTGNGMKKFLWLVFGNSWFSQQVFDVIFFVFSLLALLNLGVHYENLLKKMQMSLLSTRELDKLFSNQNLQSTQFILLAMFSKKYLKLLIFSRTSHQEVLQTLNVPKKLEQIFLKYISLALPVFL